MVVNIFDNLPHARNYANVMKRAGFTVDGPNKRENGTWSVSATKGNKYVPRSYSRNRSRHY